MLLPLCECSDMFSEGSNVRGTQLPPRSLRVRARQREREKTNGLAAEEMK